MSLSYRRRKQLISMLEITGEIRIRDIMRTFEVSEETARRDIKMLQREGLAVHVHGGAVATGQSKLLASESSLIAHHVEKDAIAKAAVALLGPDENVFLGGGSTVFSLARQIGGLPQMRIVTNMVDTAFAAAESCRHRVAMLGGDFSADARTVNGYATMRALREQCFDVAFLTADAIDPHFGVFDHDEGGQALAWTLRERARKVVILADQSKFGSIARYQILGLQDITMIVTDSEPKPEVLEILKSAEIEILWPATNRIIAG